MNGDLLTDSMSLCFQCRKQPLVEGLQMNGDLLTDSMSLCFQCRKQPLVEGLHMQSNSKNIEGQPLTPTIGVNYK